MASILHNNPHDLFKAMALQLEMDKKTKELLEQQLKQVNGELERMNKLLAHKDHIISSLELDLDHLVDQMDKLQSIKNSETCVS